MVMKTETDESVTRWSLIRKLVRSDCDEQSWEEFYRIYGHLIFAVARKSGLTPEEADDIVQETMKQVCEKIKDFVPDRARGSFKSWILMWAGWKIKDQWRKRSKFQQNQQLAADETSCTPAAEKVVDPASVDLEALWDEAWKRELFAAAVERIKASVSPAQFQIFDFCVLREMPTAKVRRALQVSPGQVYLARHRVSRLIKKEVRSLEKKLG